MLLMPTKIQPLVFAVGVYEGLFGAIWKCASHRGSGEAEEANAPPCGSKKIQTSSVVDICWSYYKRWNGQNWHLMTSGIKNMFSQVNTPDNVIDM